MFQIHKMLNVGMVRVYVDGVFDVFHYGHAEMLERVRKRFGSEATILVGVNNDEDCKKYKGKPIMNQDERCRSVSACKWVDEVLSDAPWIITQEYLDKHKIDMVCHDETPYPTKYGTKDVYEYVKSIGKFTHISRTENISTSNILHRVLMLHGNLYE